MGAARVLALASFVGKVSFPGVCLRWICSVLIAALFLALVCPCFAIYAFLVDLLLLLGCLDVPLGFIGAVMNLLIWHVCLWKSVACTVLYCLWMLLPGACLQVVGCHGMYSVNIVLQFVCLVFASWEACFNAPIFSTAACLFKMYVWSWNFYSYGFGECFVYVYPMTPWAVKFLLVSGAFGASCCWSIGLYVIYFRLLAIVFSLHVWSCGCVSCLCSLYNAVQLLYCNLARCSGRSTSKPHVADRSFIYHQKSRRASFRSQSKSACKSNQKQSVLTEP